MLHSEKEWKVLSTAHAYISSLPSPSSPQQFTVDNIKERSLKEFMFLTFVADSFEAILASRNIKHG
jgi:hypothetical protein